MNYPPAMAPRTTASTASYSPLPRSSQDIDDSVSVSSSSSYQEKQPNVEPARRRSYNRYPWSLLCFFARKTRHPKKILLYLLASLAALIAFTAVFNPSYANPPPFDIPTDGNIFIAANIVDDKLVLGEWGEALLDLVQLLGPQRTFVSVYGGPPAALEFLDDQLGEFDMLGKAVVSEREHPVDQSSLPHIELPTGEKHIKRIAYLAEVRNRALAPLNEPAQHNSSSFDKVLFINDVIFSARDAARLLFATNVQKGTGEAKYKAACAMDFINPFKYYDTYATRDLEGRGLGVPFFPFFANEGQAVSRKDIVSGRESVRVKSCWGGMVGFDARYLQEDMVREQPALSDNAKMREEQDDTQDLKLPLKFRSEKDAFWDASECCLIHADLQSLPYISSNSTFEAPSSESEPEDVYDTGIFINPYVRVSYDAKTFPWIRVAQRFERLFSLGHRVANFFASMPRPNARRGERKGETAKEAVWVSDNSSAASADTELDYGKGISAGLFSGHYEMMERKASGAGFCGVRQLLVLKEEPGKEGQVHWEKIKIPIPHN